MTKRVFNRCGRRVHLKVFVDNHETNINAPIYFYDEFCNTVASTMEEGDKFESLVISTCRGNQPLEDYERNLRFTSRYDMDCNVVLAVIAGESRVVVRYTSGNVFGIRNNMGIQRLNFFQHIESADALAQN
mmetsp:Transcript_52988/g.104566  ORF Transcript_52988/g.104566 Transcript_52988/m.104566 type:complete len:131 (-) Transcript_52988:93-485(-)